MSPDLIEDRDVDALAASVLRLMNARKPGADYLLDVSAIPGLPPLLSQYVRHVETGSAEAGRFDVVTALGPSLAGLSLAGYTAAVRRLAAHLVPGGLLILEPFRLPGAQAGRGVHAEVNRYEDRTVSSVRHVAPRDGAHVVARHALIADEHGVRHVHDERVYHSFGPVELRVVLAAADCAADLLPTALAGGPVVLGTRRRTPRGR
ncbi:hypothetical protein JIG36_31890 [Actinoplanes sp. LDG1-06]|uniref:Uncharacterized protein n=1 Tax=Paractinoplanes ovalisporus TaxID=2810368 RepID=A0ABS2AJY8_9ACTN|nr:hypothetical protein [Actinoplanes ovalisporus]MBM2620126.1 hypothetical protein [Actinoplanes ovalisporus]